MALAALVCCALLILSGPALAADPVIEVMLTIESNRFSPEEITVPAGKPFVLVVTNKDTTAEEFESKDLRIEKIVPPGKTLRLRMPPLKPGAYPFVGDFHQKTAHGRILAQ